MISILVADLSVSSLVVEALLEKFVFLKMKCVVDYHFPVGSCTLFSRCFLTLAAFVGLAILFKSSGFNIDNCTVRELCDILFLGPNVIKFLILCRD